MRKNRVKRKPSWKLIKKARTKSQQDKKQITKWGCKRFQEAFQLIWWTGAKRSPGSRTKITFITARTIEANGWREGRCNASVMLIRLTTKPSPEPRPVQTGQKTVRDVACLHSLISDDKQQQARIWEAVPSRCNWQAIGAQLSVLKGPTEVYAYPKLYSGRQAVRYINAAYKLSFGLSEQLVRQKCICQKLLKGGADTAQSFVLNWKHNKWVRDSSWKWNKSKATQKTLEIVNIFKSFALS